MFADKDSDVIGQIPVLWDAKMKESLGLEVQKDSQGKLRRVYVYVCVHICVCMCAYMRVYLCICVCLYKCIC